MYLSIYLYIYIYAYTNNNNNVYTLHVMLLNTVTPRPLQAAALGAHHEAGGGRRIHLGAAAVR